MITAIAIDDEPLALKVIEALCKQSGIIQLEKTFVQAKEALNYIHHSAPDLLFVDIHMPSMSGFNLIKELADSHCMVIFTTAFSEYAAESYELNAVDYLLKPISQKRFAQAVQKVEDYYRYLHAKPEKNIREIFIRANYNLVKLNVSDILYIEGLADYLKIHLEQNKTIVVRMPMKEMLEKLPAGEFVRIHRSYIIPIKRIEAISRSTVLIEKQSLPIGKTYMSDFFSRYSTQKKH